MASPRAALSSSPGPAGAADPSSSPSSDPGGPWSSSDERWMRAALVEAERALRRWEVPVGCVVVRDGEIVATGSNRTNELRNGTRHAEFEAIDAILEAHGGDRTAAGFDRCALYVTCEPCIMCAGALSLLGFREVCFGCPNDKFGGNGSILAVHENGCAPCGGFGETERDAASAARTYPARGGLFAQAAVKLLQDFYIRGNPKAPKPHRPLAPEAEAKKEDA